MLNEYASSIHGNHSARRGLRVVGRFRAGLQGERHGGGPCDGRPVEWCNAVKSSSDTTVSTSLHGVIATKVGCCALPSSEATHRLAGRAW